MPPVRPSIEIADKDEAPKEVKKRMVTLYSVYPSYRLALRTEKYHLRETADGKMVRVPTLDSRGNPMVEEQIVFHKHRQSVSEDVAAELKARGQEYQYGTCFISADDLKARIADPKRRHEADGFIAHMFKRDILANAENPVDKTEIYMELGITAGQLSKAKVAVPV